MKCGLLGRKLGHSYSPLLHRFFGYDYALFEKEPEELAQFLREGDFTGLNVTMPYKKAVLPYLDALSEPAARLGAVNTIVRRADGSLLGHNSDLFGFSRMLTSSGLEVQGKKVLVLGSGGAGVTACDVLRARGAAVTVISRSGPEDYDALHRHGDAAVVVNTTPIGMYPDTGVSPVRLALFPRLEGVLDVIYNPARTQLVMDARQQGLIAEGGLTMLAAQAWESAGWFTGHPLPESQLSDAIRLLRQQTENIVLVGMPGCGKSTIGALLAQRLGRPFADTDRYIAAAADMPIPDIFEKYGQARFRELETQVLTQLGRQSGLVIAVGGGAVTQARNYPLLHQNGRILWLQRAVDALAVEGRPLSLAGNLAEMYARRQPLYARFADETVTNDGTIAEALDQILEVL